MRKFLLAAAAGAMTLTAAAAANAGSYGYSYQYGAPYQHQYYSNYSCKNVLVGYRKVKVYRSNYGSYGYGGYGGHYVYIKKPIYKRVCSYSGY